MTTMKQEMDEIKQQIAEINASIMQPLAYGVYDTEAIKALARTLYLRGRAGGIAQSDVIEAVSAGLIAGAADECGMPRLGKLPARKLVEVMRYLTEEVHNEG